jgi:hypothetical protein
VDRKSTPFCKLLNLCSSIFVIILLLHPMDVQAKTCKVPSNPVDVRFTPQFGKVKYNNGHSARQLATKFGQHGKAARRRGWVMRGLTKTNLERQLAIKIKYRKSGRNRICAALSGTTLTIGYKRFRVYIARKHKPGSCEYRTTLDHENNHVRIYQSGLKKYIPQLEQQLRRTAKRLKPFETSGPDRAQSHFIAQLERGLRPLLDKMNKEMDRANANIDTVRNYKREQALCPPRGR